MAKDEYVSNDTPTRSTVFGRHISWSAIMAGLVVAMISQILFTLIGIAIGAASVEPVRGANSLEDFGAGAAMWWIISSLISLFLGAMTAGRLAGVVRKKDGALHGFLMWSAATVVTFLVAGTVLGGLFGGAFGALGTYKSSNAMMSGNYYHNGYAEREKTHRGRSNSPEGDVDLRTDQQTNYVGRTSPRPTGSGVNTEDRYAQSTTTDRDNTSTTTDNNATSTSNAQRGDDNQRSDTSGRARGNDSDNDTQLTERTTQRTSNDNDSLKGAAGTTGTTTGGGRDNDNVSITNTGGVGQDQTIGSRDVRDADAERAADAAKKVSLWALLGLLIGAAVSMFGGSRIREHDVPERARRRVSTEPVPHT